LKRFLDEYLSEVNNNWSEIRSDIEIKTDLMNSALLEFDGAFNENFGKKWLGNKYERRVNRALLDPIAFFGMTAQGLSVFTEHSDKLEDIVKASCVVPEFMAAITSTTKTTNSLFKRLEVFSGAVRKITNRPFESVALDSSTNRIYSINS
jgi:hypothetical protein